MLWWHCASAAQPANSHAFEIYPRLEPQQLVMLLVCLHIRLPGRPFLCEIAVTSSAGVSDSLCASCRCWNYSTLVGRDQKHPQLCERCSPVIRGMNLVLPETQPAAEAAAVPM